MFELMVKSKFSSAHFLKNYNGKCENLHGHNWKVEAFFSGNYLNEAYILIDFKILKEFLNKVLENLDHKLLNEIKFFKELNPSSEMIAKYIFFELKELLKDYKNILVKKINVWETENSMASFME